MRTLFTTALIVGIVLIGCKDKQYDDDAGAIIVHLDESSLNSLRANKMGAATGASNINNQTMLSEFAYDVPEGGVIGYTDASIADGAIIDGGSYWSPNSGLIFKGFVLSGGACTTLGVATVMVDMYGENGTPGQLAVSIPGLACGIVQPFIVSKIYQPSGGLVIQPVM